MAQDKNTLKNTQLSDSDADLENHGVKDIIPENEEYYTLDLKRDFDGLNEDDEDTTDISGANPLDETDDDVGEIIDKNTSEYRPRSTNQGGTVKEKDTIDEDNSDGTEVGEPGHWGVDEDTG